MRALLGVLIYEETYREQMKLENEEFTNKMQYTIELNPKAEEITEFGEKWSEKPEMENKLRKESENIRMRTIWVHYFTLGPIFRYS